MFRDAFGLQVSEGALMNMFFRARPRFTCEADKARCDLRAARVVASDETGVRIEGTNSYQWVFHCKDAVVHQPDYSRAACVVDEVMGGHVPEVWISDRYSAQQSHGRRHQTCLAHLARDTAFALEHGSDDLDGYGSSSGSTAPSTSPERSRIAPTPPSRRKSANWKSGSPIC